MTKPIVLSKNRKILLSILQQFEVSDYELITWLCSFTETLLEDIQEKLEEGDSERIEGLYNNLNALCWKISDEERPEETVELLEWIEEMEKKNSHCQ